MQKINDLKGYLSKMPDGEKVYPFLLSITDATPKGRYDFNNRVYVNVVSYDTKKGFDGIFESHKDYIDLHVIIQGEEKIYYGDRKDMTVTRVYDSQGDYELLKGDNYSVVEYAAMQGIEFETNEPHMAGVSVCMSKKILKAIIKLKK